MKYKSLLIRLPPDLHDALTRLRTERHINISAWLRSLLARELARELGPDRDPPTPPSPAIAAASADTGTTPRSGRGGSAPRLAAPPPRQRGLGLHLSRRSRCVAL